MNARALQELLDIHRRFASGTGCSDRLTVMRIHDVTTRKDPFHTGRGRNALGLDVTDCIHVKLAV